MIKLNIGCGSKLMEGYTNIDIDKSTADINAPADNLPYDTNTVDVIESYHLIEHMSYKNAKVAVIHWYSVLKPGGLLVIECPNLVKVVRRYLEGDLEMIYSIYGRDRYPYDQHLWGYTPNSLSLLLEEVGFTITNITNGTDYHARMEPCMRVEAKK